FAPSAVLIAPAVQAQAAGHQPQIVAPGTLAIETRHRDLAARYAVAGEGAVHEAETLARLALVEAGVGAQLPFQPPAGDVPRRATQGGVDAPTGRRRLILVVGRRGRAAVRRHRDGGVGEVALAPPGLQAPAIAPLLRPPRRRGGQQVAAGAGSRPGQPRAALLVIGRGA